MPLNTPADIVQKVQDAAIQVMSDPAIKKRLADQGLVASGASADVLKQFMAAEVEKYRGVITAAKITAE